MWPHHKTVCTTVVFVWKNIIAQHSGMESVSFFNFVGGPLFQARVTFICNSQTGEFCVSENVWSIFLVVFCVLKFVEFSAFLILPEHLMVLSVHPVTTVPALPDEEEKEGGRGWRDDTGIVIWAPHIQSPADPAGSFMTWLQQQCPVSPCCSTYSVLSYSTAHKGLFWIHTYELSPDLLVWGCTSRHFLTPCISSTVSTGLPATALWAHAWGFGSSHCTVWKEFSSFFSPDHFLLVFLVKERRSPLHVGAVSC